MNNGYDYYSMPAYPELPAEYSAEEHEEQTLELPPEPDDSPYEDPVVRHILSLKDDAFRRRMLSYLNENVRAKPVVHPAWVLAALILCFPVGLCLMYFCTQWGVFAKVVITLFVLGMALALYEILSYGGVIPAPSLVETVVYIFSQLVS